MIKIDDTGTGIEEKDMQKIFNRFHRTGDSRSIEGTGLGLSIVKAIIEAHGRGIMVRSEVDMGSCLDIVLPV